MLRPVNDALLETLDTYYDAAPRPYAGAEEVGPFTLFVATDPQGWPYYARPRLGLDRAVDVGDVEKVLARQAERGVTRALEWVHEITPSLLAAARAAGLGVAENPLLVLADPARSAELSRRDGNEVTGRTRLLAADDPDLPLVIGAISAGFAGTDVVIPKPADRQARMVEQGLLVVVGAYDGRGDVLGGGSHGPRGDITELTGIAVLPHARRQGVGGAVAAALAADAHDRGLGTVFLSAQDDAVARVYERVGFVRVGTACVAEEAST